MTKQKEIKPCNRDITHNPVSTARFLFYLQLGCFIAFIFGGCYMFYTKRYRTRDVPVQKSTLYTPQYK